MNRPMASLLRIIRGKEVDVVLAMANAFYSSIETDQVGVQLLELALMKSEKSHSTDDKSSPNHPGEGSGSCPEVEIPFSN